MLCLDGGRIEDVGTTVGKVCMSDVLERFLRFAQVDPQSDPNNEQVTPSTPRQHQMARVLGDELLARLVAEPAVAGAPGEA